MNVCGLGGQTDRWTADGKPATVLGGQGSGQTGPQSSERWGPCEWGEGGGFGEGWALREHLQGMLCSWGVPGRCPRRTSLSPFFWNQLKPLLLAAAFCPCASSRGLAVPTGSVPGCGSMALTWGRWPKTPAWGFPAGWPEAGRALSHPVPLPLPPCAPPIIVPRQVAALQLLVEMPDPPPALLSLVNSVRRPLCAWQLGGTCL